MMQYVILCKYYIIFIYIFIILGKYYIICIILKIKFNINVDNNNKFFLKYIFFIISVGQISTSFYHFFVDLTHP